MAQLETIVIRKAVIDDLSQMLQVMDEALGSPTADDELEQQVKDWSIKFNNCSQFLFYVAEVNHGLIVGWCRGGRVVEPHKIVAEEVYDCEIHNIFLRKQYQSRGIGYELWKVVWNDVLLLFKPRNFVVWAVETQQAHRFCSSLGGKQKETKTFGGNCVSTAFIWSDPQPYNSVNFLLIK